MIDVMEGGLISKNYRFEAYFDAARCIPNMGSNGTENLLSNGKYFMTACSIKHKIRKEMQRMGARILHVDDEDHTPIIKRLIGDEPPENYNVKQYMEMEKEYADIRLFGTLDLLGVKKDKGKKDKNHDKKDGRITKQDTEGEFEVKECRSGPVSITHPETLNPVTIFNGSGSRSYDVRHENGKNVGSGYDNPYWFVEYGLFKLQGGVNLDHVKYYGITVYDLDMFFEAMWNMFDRDSSTYRPMGSMLMRRLTVWEWDAANVNPRNETIKSIDRVERMKFKGYGYGGAYCDSRITPARDFDDYEEYQLPKEGNGVKVYTRS